MDKILKALWTDDDALSCVRTTSTTTDTSLPNRFAEFPNGYVIQWHNPCEHCANNPKNNPASSGFCHCVLGTVTTFTAFEVE